MMVVMVTPRNGFHVHSAVGVSGFVVLFLLLGGFVAMHGVAATTATGVHHNPVTVLAVTEDHVAEQVPVTGPASPMAHTQPHGDVQPRAADSTASTAVGHARATAPARRTARWSVVSSSCVARSPW